MTEENDIDDARDIVTGRRSAETNLVTLVRAVYTAEDAYIASEQEHMAKKLELAQVVAGVTQVEVDGKRALMRYKKTDWKKAINKLDQAITDLKDKYGRIKQRKQRKQLDPLTAEIKRQKNALEATKK